MGILDEEKEGQYPICVEPEDCGYDPVMFSGVQTLAEHLEAVDEDRHILHSHPTAQESHLQGITDKALKDAIQQTVRRHDEHRKVISFCFLPVVVEGYRVCIVLQFNRRAFESHYALINDKAFGRSQIATSLIDASIREYFRQWLRELERPDPGADLGSIDRDYNEIIRSAGKYLMYTPANAGRHFTNYMGYFTLATQSRLSATKVQKASGKCWLREGNTPISRQPLICPRRSKYGITGR